MIVRWSSLGEPVAAFGGQLSKRSKLDPKKYLKTFRLSAAQTRRAYLLQQLAAHAWEIDATAKFFQMDHSSFVLRMENAGFGYLLKPHILEEARRKQR